jgi:hypothetical protein
MRDARDELIRIDAQGVAHPIGTVASQRMRPHRGTYRLLPGPDHVVFMRYTGEDGRVDEGDGAIVRLAGELTAPGTVCDVLALVGQTGWRGILSVHEDDITRSLYLDQGNVIGVQTNAPGERLGQIMFRYGLLSEAQLAEAEGHVTQGRRFGEVALELGFLQKEEVYKAIRLQVEEVVFGAMGVADGTFFFLEGLDEAHVPTRQLVSVNALLMDGVTRMDEVKYFQEKIPSKAHVPQRVEGVDKVAAEYQNVWAHVDGKTSVEELGRVTGLGEFETTKKIFALAQAKQVVILPPRRTGGPAAIVVAANDVLSAAFRAAEQDGQGEELRRSLSSFAVGAGVVYDLLFRGAGPDEYGRLDPERVAANAPLVAPEDDPEKTVRQLLFDYASFALFSIGAYLGKDREAALQRDVREALARLRP